MDKTHNKEKIALLLTICALLLVIEGSYAYWQFVVNQDGSNRVGSTCLSISLEDVTEGIRLEKAYPILDEEGMETAPYEFTITNTCDTFISYDVILGVLDETTMNSGYIAAVLDRGAIQTLNTYESTTVDGYKEAYILQTDLYNMVCKFII